MEGTNSWDSLVSDRTVETLRSLDERWARGWLAKLHETVESMCERHNLDVVGALSGGALSAVIEVTCGADRAVLKVCHTPGLAVGEAATLRAWSVAAANAGRLAPCPEVIDVDEETGAYLMSHIAGEPSHRTPVASMSATRRVAALLEVVAASQPQRHAPLAAAFVSPSTLESVLEGAPPDVVRWLVPLRASLWALDEVSGGPADCAAHGDLWAGNILTAAGDVWLIDPFPMRARVEFDVARFCADGWLGPGVAERVEFLCDHLEVDRRLVWALVAVCATFQVSSFHRHHWDTSPVRGGLDDVFNEVEARLL